MRARVFTAVFAATTTALVLAGCGQNDSANTTPPGGTQPPGSAQQHTEDHNQADIAFAQGMIPHHAQAIEMARLAQQRAQSPQVKDLARQIEQAQGPEIATMTTWLQQWGAPPPSTTAPGQMGHGGGMGPMPGMMDAHQMNQLGHGSGAEFDRMFLQMMIQHHKGAITMAQTELTNGQNPAAKQLAQQIIDTQQAEIQKMQNLLSQI